MEKIATDHPLRQAGRLHAGPPVGLADTALNMRNFSDGHAVALIVLFAVAIAAALRPFQNTPFIDDWTYAWSVEHFLNTGQLRILDWSAHINPVQTLWGSLFCLPFGFSFSALRISTWVLSVIGILGLFKLLRAAGVSLRDSLIAACLLEVCPIYLMLSATYMTDVPWLTMAIWFAYSLIRAVLRRQDWWLVAATLFGCAAGAIRPTGVLFPLVALAVLCFHAGAWGKQPVRLLIPLAGLAGLAIMILERDRYTTRVADVGMIAEKVANIKVGVLMFHKFALEGLIGAAATLGILLFPWAAGSLSKENWRRTAITCTGLLLMIAVLLGTGGHYDRALVPGAIWSVYELGYTEGLVNHHIVLPTPRWLQWALGFLAFPAFSVALAAVFRRPCKPAFATLSWILAAVYVQIVVLWLFHDRYYLVALPFLVASLLIQEGFAHPSRAVAAGVVFLVLSYVGVRDHLEYNRAVWAAVAYLREQGVNPGDINGGYVVNGWLQYAHPENARRDRNGNPLVPWVTQVIDLPFQISNQPLADWQQIKVIPYGRWLGYSGAIYVLEPYISIQQ
jgi:hypothetical protein